MLDSVNDFIDADLVHSVHTSERKSFRGCRRRWDWVSRQFYYPNITARPLEFGTAYHAALETYYAPETWQKKPSDRTVMANAAIMEFKKVVEEQRLKFIKNNGGNIDAEMDADYADRVELGLGMLRYHLFEIAPTVDEGLTPRYVEVKFEVPITDEQGNGLRCKCQTCWRKFTTYVVEKSDGTFVNDNGARVNLNNFASGLNAYGDVFWKGWQGLPVTYGGRIDAIMESDDGRLWIFDWKHLNVNEPILTPSGWVKMGDLRDGDYVVGKNGKPTKVIAASPVTQQEVYEVEFRDGTVVECSPSHKWDVYLTHGTGTTRVMTTQEIAEAPTYHKFATPQNDVIEFNRPVELPMHPYALGALLGNGHSERSELSFSSKTGDTIPLLSQYLPEGMYIQDNRHFGNNKWVILGAQDDKRRNQHSKETNYWRAALRDLGLWGKSAVDKFIPEDYLFASVEDRVLLLQGLADTDGNTGLFRFSSTSKQLAEDTCHLIRSLGGSASISSSKERLHSNGKTINKAQHFVNYWVPEWIEPNQLERKRVGRVRKTKGTHCRSIKSVRKTDRTADMRCIAVDAPDNLYITKDFAVTHNTAAQLSRGNDDFLLLEDQIVSYCWALKHVLNIDIAGFIWHEQKKAFPHEPEPNKNRRLGRLFSVSKQQDTNALLYKDTVEENDPHAFVQGLYDEFIEWLEEQEVHYTNGNGYYQRYQVIKSDVELKQAGQMIFHEAADMTDLDLRVYPNPGRFHCGSCAFKEPCKAQNNGEDFMYALNTLYEKRTRHYWQDPEVKPTTEKKESTL